MRSEFKGDDEALDDRVMAALEKAPRPEIPTGFAARVTAAAVARQGAVALQGTAQRAVFRETRYGPLALYGGLLVLVLVMLAATRLVAPGATFVVECVLVAEFVGLGLCLGLAPGMLR